MTLKSNRASRRIIYLLSPFIFIILILSYYQLLYHSEHVNKGFASLDRLFTGHANIVTAVRFLPGDSLLVTSSVDSTIQIWERTSGRIKREIKQPSGIAYMDVSDDGQYACTGAYDAKVRVWRIS